MSRVSELFEVTYGVNLELNKMKVVPAGTPGSLNFVSRTEKNNGVSARVMPVEGVEPTPAGVITVAGGGSVMSSFLQPEPFYSGRDLYYLTSKAEMSDREKLFYALCLRANKYRYNYGRQANRTLRDLELPDSPPEWVMEAGGFVDLSIISFGSGINAAINEMLLASSNDRR